MVTGKFLSTFWFCLPAAALAISGCLCTQSPGDFSSHFHSPSVSWAILFLVDFSDLYKAYF